MTALYTWREILLAGGVFDLGVDELKGHHMVKVIGTKHDCFIARIE
jgi:hypothetical protein